jgi:hypothetical protein
MTVDQPERRAEAGQAPFDLETDPGTSTFHDPETAPPPLPGTSALPGPSESASGGGWFHPAAGSRSRRAAVRLLAALAISVGFATAIGLLVALLTGSFSSDSPSKKTTPPALALPSSGAGSAAAQVPADWVPQTSNSGIPFSAPPGWTQRADAVVDFRVAPAATGGRGVEQVGVGLSSSSDPQAAAATYARNTYSGQPSYLEQPATDEVSFRGERGRQVTVTYSRSGSPVQVVIRSFPTPRGVLLVVSRAAIADQERADQLVGQLDASIRLP